MGRKDCDTSASDRSPPRKARRTSLHKSSASKSSSTTQGSLGTVQQSTESEKKIGSTKASGRTSPIALDQSDVQHVSKSSSVILQRSAKPNQYTPNEKKLRTLKPAPSKHPRAPTPPPPKKEIFIDENGRHKIRLPRRYPISSRNDPASSPATSTTLSPQQKPSDIPLTSSEPLPLQFDPSQCVWHALRDVAFVKDENIEMSMGDLCALLSFRYSEMDVRMETVDEREVLAMREFVRARGMQMYETKYPRFLRSGMEADLRIMREGGKGGGSWEV